MRVLPDTALGVDLLALVQPGHIRQAFLPLLIDIHHTAGRFEKLRQARRIVTDVVDQFRITRRRRTMPIRHQAIVILALVSDVETNEPVLAGDRIPLLVIEGRLD
ncbi:MAG: hypothetical protein WB005_12395, partial [Pseudolabrys sp.]